MKLISVIVVALAVSLAVANARAQGPAQGGYGAPAQQPTQYVAAGPARPQYLAFATVRRVGRGLGELVSWVFSPRGLATPMAPVPTCPKCGKYH